MDELVMERTAGDLRISMSWASMSSVGSAAEATWGRLWVAVRDQGVWHGELTTDGFEWSWIELLEHLVWAWPYLLLEDGTPLRVKLDTAPRMLAAAEAALEDDDLTRVEFERDLVYGYVETHDLAQAVQGAVLPPLWIVRQGSQGWISTNNWIGAAPFDELVNVLEELGEVISARLVGLKDERSKRASAQWANRSELNRSDIIKAATGYPSELVAEVESAFLSTTERDWTDLRSDELLAAARSLGPLPASMLLPVLDAIREAPRVESDVLDALSHSAVHFLSEYDDRRPYEQGYALAEWLRSRPGVTSPAGRVDPHSLLAMWGVPIVESALNLTDLDAIGCWGPEHGPTIILNINGAHFDRPAGRRVTLAHEIAHLLVDRHRSLPLVEVLAGRSAEKAEARARAFAADLLLPRDLAAEVFFGAASFESAMRTLLGRFGVGSEIVAWQVKNSGTPLDPSAAKYLSKFVSQPSRFR